MCIKIMKMAGTRLRCWGLLKFLMGGGVDGRAQINEKRFFVNDGKLYTTEHRSPSEDLIKSNEEY